MKVYVDELPNSCQKCPFCEYFEKDAHGKGKHEVACYFNGSLGNILYGNQTSPKTCPLQTLADHDKQVRAEVMDKNQALKERWEKLKEYITQETEVDYMGCYIYPDNLKAMEDILEKMQELEK